MLQVLLELLQLGAADEAVAQVALHRHPLLTGELAVHVGLQEPFIHVIHDTSPVRYALANRFSALAIRVPTELGATSMLLAISS